MIALPTDYQCLEDAGLLERLRNAEDPLRLYGLDFLSQEDVGYPLVEPGQLFPIFPFAANPAGDHVGYLVERLPRSPICLFYHDSDDASAIAGNVGQLVFRTLLDLAASRPVDGNGTFWTSQGLRKYIGSMLDVFAGFLLPGMTSMLRSVASSNRVHRCGQFRVLISEAGKSEAIEKHVLIRKEYQQFMWRRG